MEKQITVRQAGLLRLATWAAGDAQVKRDLVKIRQIINEALQPFVDAKRITLGDMGSFGPVERQETALDEVVTLDLSSAQWGVLNIGLQTTRWPMLSETIEAVLFDLLDHVPEWAQQAHALEEFERLPPEKREQVAAMIAKKPA